MTDIEFIKKLKHVSLTFKEYKEMGLDDDFIVQMIERFNPVKKNEAGFFYKNDDEVIELINNYDLSKTEIGMISFFKAPIVSDNRVYFGNFELDRLFLDTLYGEINCCEEKTDCVLYKCAKNGSAFLAAVFEAACFLEKRGINEELYNNEDISAKVAKHCAEIAGGLNYLDFYTVLLS